MPKNTNQKNSKGSKTTKSSSAKTGAAKKTQVKKVETKKPETKKNTVKRVEAKEVSTKKVETKEIPVKKVETKVTEKKEIIKEEKGTKDIIIDKVSSNIPFVVSLCVIVILIGALIFTLSIKKVPKTKNGDEIVATVNGKTITANDLYDALKEGNGTDTLINLVDSYIADKEVTITKENEDYVQEVVDYYKDYADYYGVDLATFLANYVGLSGVSTEEEFYNYVLDDYKKTLAITKFIGDSASEEDLKKYYEENYTDKLTVKHILIEVDSESDDKDKADDEAYKKAMDLIKKLNNTDASKLDAKFEELAEDYSDDTGTYSKGGLIEGFSKSDVVEAFWDASYKLKDGEYTTKPVKSSYGYHIILKVSSTPVEKFEDIKDDVKNSYADSLLSKDSTLFIKKWDELRKQYKLSIEDDFIKETYENTIKEATKTEE